jgi:geranylgeranyl pyrophosphate synthase
VYCRAMAPAEPHAAEAEFRQRLCRTLVEELLREVELHLIEVRSAQFLANYPWPAGKRLRPIVFLLSNLSVQAVGSGGAVSANGRESRLAAAIELLHEASLVHDDIVDRSATRRGVPSVHTANGDGMAVLIGDYMVFRGMKLILDSATSLQDVALARELTDTGLRIAHGEIDQLHRHLNRSDERMGLDEYLDVISHKTAGFFGGCAEAGAALAGAPAPLRRHYRRFGTNLGLAFQMVDDVMDVFGDSDKARKPLRNDLAEGTATLPVIHAYEAFPDDPTLQRFGRGETLSEDERASLYGLLHDDEILRRCAASVRKHAGIAERALREMPSNIFRMGLADVLAYVTSCSWGGLEDALEGASADG